MKKVTNAIFNSEGFDKKCMAELFHLLQDGRTDFVRGFVCLEVKVKKGVEMYTLYRLDKKGETYEVEIDTTSDKNLIATHLYNIGYNSSYGWLVPFESARDAINCGIAC